jgi:preprotein translocase subunit SecD
MIVVNGCRSWHRRRRMERERLPRPVPEAVEPESRVPVRGRLAPPCRAAARPDRTTGTWAVELTLAEAGVARLAALYRDVGVGGQYAVIVDGKLVSVQRFDAAPSGKALITGLDEPTATRIAGRLPR